MLEGKAMVQDTDMPVKMQLLAMSSAYEALDLFDVLDCKSIAAHIKKFIDAGTMISPTVLARRCVSFLMNNMLQEALGDAMQAQVVSPDWPTAYFLQAATLLSLGMDGDAQEMIKTGTKIEAKRNNRN